VHGRLAWNAVKKNGCTHALRNRPWCQWCSSRTDVGISELRHFDVRNA
jgi:hypothetical protein